jgi:uroporphyrin-3 C-methyltransferase
MPDAAPPPPHSHRVTVLIAVVGVLVAGYALWRVDSVRDREDATRDRVQQLETANATLRAELTAAAERENKARIEAQEQWRAIASLPQQVRDLTAAHEDLRSRTERPQRAWSRAEALYLIELAERRLHFDRDIATAIVALETADARLASLRDASLNAVRERVAKDLQTLRAAPEPDRTGIMARLLAIEAQVERLPLKGSLVGQRAVEAETFESPSWFARTWRSTAGVFERMFVVRRLSKDNLAVVTVEEQALRRQHLSLLIFSARSAVLRSDASAYRVALDDAHKWLDQYFGGNASVQAAAEELAALAKIDIAPELPNVAGAAQMLARGAPAVQSAP